MAWCSVEEIKQYGLARVPQREQALESFLIRYEPISGRMKRTSRPQGRPAATTQKEQSSPLA